MESTAASANIFRLRLELHNKTVLRDSFLVPRGTALRGALGHKFLCRGGRGGSVGQAVALSHCSGPAPTSVG